MIIYYYDWRVCVELSLSFDVHLLWTGYRCDHQTSEKEVSKNPLCSNSILDQYGSWIFLTLYWNHRLINQIDIFNWSKRDPAHLLTSSHLRELLQFWLVHLQEAISSNFHPCFPLSAVQCFFYHVRYQDANCIIIVLL